MQFDIVFRSCSSVNSVHGTPRVTAAPKSEIIIRCLNSLVASLAFRKTGLPEKTRLSVLDDHSDPETLNRIQKILARATISTRLISLGEKGNAHSIRECYELARKDCYGLLYFVEDDYLHAPEALSEMLDAYFKFKHAQGQEVVIHPCDYPDRYLRAEPSAIVLGSHRHWRGIRHTTGTFMLHRLVLDRYWNHYERFTQYGVDPGVSEDTTINLVYKQVPCYSPLPSLAVHLQTEGCVPPFIPWEKWWDAAE